MGILSSPAQELVRFYLHLAQKLLIGALKGLKNNSGIVADLNKIIDELSTLTVVEAAELSKQRGKMGRYGSSASNCNTNKGNNCWGGKSKFSIFLVQGIKN